MSKIPERLLYGDYGIVVMVVLPISIGAFFLLSGYELDNPLGTLGTMLLFSSICIIFAYLIIRYYKKH